MNSTGIEYRVSTATRDAILEHLHACSNTFIPPLHDTVDLARYATKLFERSVTFEAWSGTTLAGLVAAYLNDGVTHAGYITNVSVLPAFAGRGIARRLVEDCIRRAKELTFERVGLEVAGANVPAISLYRKLGFIEQEQRGRSVMMTLAIEPTTESGQAHES